MTETILVTGATGKTGTALVDILNASTAQARTATRKPRARGDIPFEWQDVSTHRAALDGVSAVYLVAPTDTTDHLATMRPFLERALECGVDRFVLLSASVLEEGGSLMGEVHAWLAASAPRWIVLRPTWFMQNFVTQHLPGIVGDRAIYSATSDGRVPFIDVRDIAAVAAGALLDPDLANCRAPVLTGPEALTYADVAALISNVAGEPVQHVDLTIEELAARHRRVGMPADYATVLAELDNRIARGGEDCVSDEVSLALGRPPISFARFAQEHAAVFRGT